MGKTLRLIGFSFLLIAISCEKGSPGIQIISPQNGQTFNGGASVEVKAQISDSDAIQGESIVVTTEDFDTIFDYKNHDFNGQSHILIKSFNATSAGNCNIQVGAFGHSSWSYKSITVHLN